MIIRGANEGDKPSIWAMLEPVFRAGETYAIDRDISGPAALDYWFGPERRVFVAEDGAELLGTYYIVRNQKGGGSHVCNCGYVTAAAARGKGVARAMLAHSLDLAPTLGFRAMQYNCVISTNTRAVDTWTRAGFDTVGRLPGAFEMPDGQEVDALVMFRRL
ncbi:GNAT family N-acetyltransferase [Tropicibacter naphthalenivorans]|uniref:Acetyltransferase (GNAT) family protein n=1 Tax=Tropicibacter naphthalenivorans TaxID=441103 RepID=A0A0P1GCG9_9RHOB|nr:GNAT family N-acetyltransferase [Tropicibacter naphthalenivorans]CUH79056.1 Acetyltransferase (GNAT) family protein [Tropicibacter naphthalenivorans]SMD03708.1 L-amino acid N-acyltransferase YncA [Tropicibacter naphthalenivorans]